MSTIRVRNREYPFSIGWKGQSLTRGKFRYLGIDTEFDKDSHELALISVSNGCDTLLMHPGEFREFQTVHAQAIWVMHNAATDWHQLAKVADLPAWKDALDEGRVRDSMILDMLVRLAQDSQSAVGASDSDGEGGTILPRRLSAVASQYLGTSKDDDDPYRTRFGELIGVDWSTVDPGFFLYAAKDPIITLLTYLELEQVALDIARSHNAYIPANGVLTERIQVEGAIALAAIEANGLGIDQAKLKTHHTRILEKLRQIEEWIVVYHPDVTRRHGKRARKNTPGELKRAASGALTLTNMGKKLETIGHEIGLPIIPLTPKQTVSTSTVAWYAHKDKHDFLSNWIDYSSTSKLLGFVNTYLDKERVHPRYSLLAKTGRTSCRSPNLQQVPKGEFRQIFIPTLGKKLWVGDLAGAELCTFAAFARATYGFSVMGDQLAAGRNVHAFFASKILGVPYEDFLALKKSDPSQFAKLRQIAKPANFGLLGGMGADAFVMYAAGPAYKVTLSLDEAKGLISQWEHTFPEGKLHRSSLPEYRSMAHNLKCSVSEVESLLTSREHWYTIVLEKVARGLRKKDGGAYSPYITDQVWNDLASLARDPDLIKIIKARKGSEEFASRVFRRDVVIPTGRIVGNVGYTELRNYPFQGLASDLKRALWKLYKADYHLVGFIHDELLLECDNDEQGRCIAKIIEDEMTSVCGGQVPFTVEWHLADNWTKP